VWWVIVVVVLIALLYVFFKPTGQIVLEPGTYPVLNESGNETDVGNETEEEVGLVPGEIDACGELAEAGTYTLTADVVAAEGEDCLVVSAADVVVDCDDNSITGGVSTDQTGTVVKDCVVDIVEVTEGGDLDIVETMAVTVVNQNDVAVAGATADVSVEVDNESVSLVSGNTNEEGIVNLGVVVTSYNTVEEVNSIEETSYDSYTLEVSLDGFNGSSSDVDAIADINVTITDVTAPVITLDAVDNIEVDSARLEFDIVETGEVASCTASVKEGESEIVSVAVADAGAGSNHVDVEGLDDETRYNAQVVCLDSVGLEGASNSVSFETLAEESSDTSSGESSSSSESSSENNQQGAVLSSPGSFNMTYRVSPQQFDNGYTRALKETEQVRIIVNGNVVLVQAVEIGETSVKMTDGTSTMDIAVGNVGSFDVDADKVYDIMVILRGVEGEAASLTFVRTSEPVKEIVEESVEEASVTGDAVSDEGRAGITGQAAGEVAGMSKTNAILTILVIIVLIVLGVVIYRWIKLKKGKKGGKKKEEVKPVVAAPEMGVMKLDDKDKKPGFFARLFGKKK